MSALKVKVLEQGIYYLFQPSCPDAEDFWGLEYQPRVRVGDDIFFIDEDENLIAQAEVSRIESPFESTCGATCRFKNKWKVFWKKETFVRI